MFKKLSLILLSFLLLTGCMELPEEETDDPDDKAMNK